MQGFYYPSSYSIVYFILFYLGEGVGFLYLFISSRVCFCIYLNENFSNKRLYIDIDNINAIASAMSETLSENV